MQGLIQSTRSQQHNLFYSRHSMHVSELQGHHFDLSWLQGREFRVQDKASTMYLVKWKNLSYIYSTWETEQDLLGDAEKIKDFQRHNRALLKEQRQEFISRNQKQ